MPLRPPPRLGLAVVRNRIRIRAARQAQAQARGGRGLDEGSVSRDPQVTARGSARLPGYNSMGYTDL